MPRRVNSGRRRRLLREMERLAQVAIFGTLSETYRTCGHPGCHCHGPGPKHGPPARQLSGRAGQDHRLLRAQSGRAGHAARRSRLAGTAAVFKGTGGVEQATQFAARPRGRRVMKRWLWLALAGLGVCLLLALGHPEAGRGADSHPCLAGWARSVGPWGEPTAAPPTAVPAARKAAPRQAHAAPSESDPLHLLTERGIGPPWLDSRGPPGKVRGTWVDSRAAGQIGSPKEGGAYASPTRSKHPLAGATAATGVLQQPLTRLIPSLKQRWCP
jgi:hypothetical protein